jgi:hypothetical protein
MDYTDNYTIKENEKDLLRVCEHCLQGIESHEGQQITRQVYFDDEDIE